MYILGYQEHNVNKKAPFSCFPEITLFAVSVFFISCKLNAKLNIKRDNAYLKILMMAFHVITHDSCTERGTSICF